MCQDPGNRGRIPMCLAFSKSANTVAPSLPKPQTYRLECFLEAQLLDILDLLCISRREEDLDAYIGSDLVGPRELQNGRVNFDSLARFTSGYTRCAAILSGWLLRRAESLALCICAEPFRSSSSPSHRCRRLGCHLYVLVTLLRILKRCIL